MSKMTWGRLLRECPDRLTVSEVFDLSLRGDSKGWRVPEQVTTMEGVVPRLRYVRRGERFDRSDLVKDS